MTLRDIVEQVARDWATATVTVDGGVRLATHCLYPSNGAVNVRVIGGKDTFVVSDEGGAVDDALASGLSVDRAARMIAGIARRNGLRFEDGAIASPPVPLSDVQAAILLVANSSKQAAHWCLDNIKIAPPSRNFRELLREFLDARYRTEIQHRAPILGKSNKQWHFDHLLHARGDRTVLVDPVINEASSINARVVANMDVRSLEDPRIIQRIVYDDREEWRSSDLSLLSIGARVVPFSRAEDVIDRLMKAA